MDTRCQWCVSTFHHDFVKAHNNCWFITWTNQLHLVHHPGYVWHTQCFRNCSYFHHVCFLASCQLHGNMEPSPTDTASAPWQLAPQKGHNGAFDFCIITMSLLLCFCCLPNMKIWFCHITHWNGHFLAKNNHNESQNNGTHWTHCDIQSISTTIDECRHC